MGSCYSVERIALDEFADLKSEWLALEREVNCSFFLSWTWISAWLESYRPNGFVLRIRFEQKTIALAIFVPNAYKVRYRPVSNRFLLHQTGDWLKDQIWIEYNGILCDSEHEEIAQSEILQFFSKSVYQWDELVFGGISGASGKSLQCLSGLDRIDRWHSSTYGVDLQQLRHIDCSYLDSLSKNTRYQIRRSFKKYAEYGALEVRHAKTVSEALCFFDNAGPLHIKRWGASLGQSGFANPHFVDFHKTLITKAWPKGEVDLIQVTHGERVIGYLYNFLFRNTVYFYLSGLVAEQDSKLKPGLCSHALVIEEYKNKEYDYYDFMAGEDRYKASLGKIGDELFQISLRKARIKFKFEALMRRCKNAIFD